MSEMTMYENEDGSEWRCEEDGVYSVLDHGYLEKIETWGSDEGIVETARMSTNKGFLGWDPGPCPSCSGSGVIQKNDYDSVSCLDCGGKGQIPGDAKLLRYLYEHKHSTPFEFAGLTIEIQAPIMVFREWHRHRTQSYSEMSARYVQMPNLHYVPSVRRIIDSARKSGNRQASGAGALRFPDGVDYITAEETAARQIRKMIADEQASVYRNYEKLISFGVAKEVARLDTPVSRYSKCRATGNLRNWLAFLTLRMDANAQFEIRQFAWALADVISTAYPRTWALFLDGMAPKKIWTADQVAILERAKDELRDSINFMEAAKTLLDNGVRSLTESGIQVPVDILEAEKNITSALGKVPGLP